MPPKKGQSFNRYSIELKTAAVRLRLEEGYTLSQIVEKLGLRSDAQIVAWVKKHTS